MGGALCCFVVGLLQVAATKIWSTQPDSSFVSSANCSVELGGGGTAATSDSPQLSSSSGLQHGCAQVSSSSHAPPSASLPVPRVRFAPEALEPAISSSTSLQSTSLSSPVAEHHAIYTPRTPDVDMGDARHDDDADALPARAHEVLGP